MHPAIATTASFALLSTLGVAAQVPADLRPISEFHHTTWTAEEGAPSDASMLAQTTDGWLWLGGPSGLFRFDGVQFERVLPEGRNPDESMATASLFAEDSGDLWVGYVFGGVSRLGNGGAQHYGESDGLPAATITALARDAQGVLWAGTASGLLWFDGTRWNASPPASGFTDPHVVSLMLDELGTLWIAGAQYVFRLRKGEQRIERTSLQHGNYAEFMKSPDGRAWWGDLTGARLLPDQVTTRRRARAANAQVPRGMLFDTEGHLWVTVSDQGVRRHVVPHDAQEIVFRDSAGSHVTSRDRLTSNRTHALLEDIEGNVWIATAGGLDRFRHNNVRKVPTPGGQLVDIGPVSVTAADAGAVWIGAHPGAYGSLSTLSGLWKFDGTLTRVAPNVIKEVSASNRDVNGAVWIGGAQGLWRQTAGDQFRRLPDLPAEVRGNLVHALTVDGVGDPWVSVVRGSLYRLRNGTWETNGNVAALPSTRPQVHTRDPAGHMWFGYRDGRIAVLEGSNVRWYGADEGLRLGMISAIHVGRFTAVAGPRAVAVLRDGRFRTLQAAEGSAALESVAGITESRDGDLWVNGARGAARIAARDLDEALRSGRYTVTPELFDAQDGFPGTSAQLRPLPTVIRGTDDRLWFSGTLGVGWLDPERLSRNPVPPPVTIRAVISDGATYPNAGKVQLPQGTRNLQVSYTALSLSQPERVRFRYRLDGYDQGWVDAGTRRNAFYTNLPPGSYQFRVIAANESGVWNNAGASIGIGIPPTFTETGAFIASCVLAGLAVLWAAYVVRIRQVTARERGRLAERLGERERIARELHDTLLQGVQGLILKLQVVVDRSDLRESRQVMHEALDRADALLVQGRDRVKELRSTGVPTSFSEQLLESIGPMSGENRPRLRIIENGAPRDLHSIVREEAVRIATEATLNAVKHAAAASIEIQVSYEHRRLRVSVRDDGRGMDEAVIRAGRQGHFGLTGMRERAQRIRGQVEIQSRTGGGTEVSLTVPASMAYERRRWLRA